MPRQPHSTAPNAAVFGAQPPEPATYRLDDDGRTPNSRWPVLHYRSTSAGPIDPAVCERRFAANGWPPQWRGGVFDFHHYHSVSHEALAIHAGAARLMLGGEAGRIVEVAAGEQTGDDGRGVALEVFDAMEKDEGAGLHGAALVEELGTGDGFVELHAFRDAVELFTAHKAFIGLAVVQQLLNKFAVSVKPLGLINRARVPG